MAAARAPILRHLTSCQPRFLRASNQRRWAQVHDVRFLATTQQPRNVIEKYREKLDRKAREEGLEGIDSLKEAYADKIQDLRMKDAIPPNQGPSPTSSEQTPPQPASPASSPPSAAAAASITNNASRSSTPAVKPLSAYLDIDKARTLPATELSAVWRLRHAASPQRLCATVPSRTYAAMEAAARRCPQFVLPVPHPGQGAEIHFLQWTFDDGAETGSAPTSTVLFTQLAEYKNRGEFAQPHTSITHHLDFAAEKDVVLMEGNVVEGRGAKVEDAQWLVMCLQRFYGGWDGQGAEGQSAADDLARERAEERRKLLDWFGRGDARFSVEKLMEEAERLG